MPAKPHELDKKALGDVILHLRTEGPLGWLSQDQLAEKAGVFRTFVGQIERGERKPTVESIYKILKPLRVSMEGFGVLLDKEIKRAARRARSAARKAAREEAKRQEVASPSLSGQVVPPVAAKSPRRSHGREIIVDAEREHENLPQRVSGTHKRRPK